VELTRDLSSPKTREGSFRAPRHMRALFVCQRAGRANLRELAVSGRTVNLRIQLQPVNAKSRYFRRSGQGVIRILAFACDAGPCSRPAGLRVQTLPAARRNDSRGILRCQPLLDGKSPLWG
jgi:hypothetical protein